MPDNRNVNPDGTLKDFDMPPDSLTPSGDTKKPTIAELEAILESDAQAELEILPNGEIRRAGKRVEDKPITFRDNLGGEYGEPLVAPCVICGTMTVWACSDCAITHGKTVHICKACMREHDKEHPEVNHVAEAERDKLKTALSEANAKVEQLVGDLHAIAQDYTNEHEECERLRAERDDYLRIVRAMADPATPMNRSYLLRHATEVLKEWQDGKDERKRTELRNNINRNS